MVFSSYGTVEKNHAVELHKNTWLELYSNRRKLIVYTVLESMCDEFCAKSHAPRWNTLDAIEVLVRPYMQLFHFWAIFGHYWPFWLI